GAGRVNPAAVAATIEAAIKRALGSEGPFVAAIAPPDVYFKPGIYDRLKEDPAAMKAVSAAVTQIPGVARVITSDDVVSASARTSKDLILRAAALSYFPGRSGDLVIVPKENWIFATAGTTHGAPYAYDQHVPVILYGAGIRPGVYDEAATPADIAPTLASMLDLRLPSPDGHVLTSALAK